METLGTAATNPEINMLFTRTSSRPFEVVIDRLYQSVPAHQFGVIETIDLQAKMNAKGIPFDRRCTVLEVCNPVQAKKILEQDMSISAALPCKISVYEQDGKVVVAMVPPSKLLGVFGDSPDMLAVASEVEKTLVRIISDACDDEPG